MKNVKSTFDKYIDMADKRAWDRFIQLLSEDSGISSTQDEFGSSLLITIIPYLPPVEVIEKLVDIGSNVNLVDSTGSTCLHELAERCEDIKSLDLARVLLLRGFDVRLTGSNGWTVLHLTSCRGCAEFVNLLIQFGADVNARSDSIEEETPLMVAARHGNSKVIQTLLEHGADPKMIDRYGRTARDHACFFFGRWRNKSVLCLLERK